MKKPVKKYNLGGLVGTASGIAGGITPMGMAGMGLNLISAFNAPSKVKKEEEALLAKLLEQKKIQDTYEASNTSGNEGVQYYAKGGRLPSQTIHSKGKYKTKGGILSPIAEDVEEVIGNEHDETNIDGTTGVKLLDNGIPVAEVEDGEVIAKDALVYSDELKADKNNTYADKMKQIGKHKAKLQKDLEEAVIPAQRNTVNRKLVFLDEDEKDLFLKQEAAKEETVTNKMAKGGIIPTVEDILGEDPNDDLINKKGYKGAKTPVVKPKGNYTETFADIGSLAIDNIGNFAMNLNSPKVPNPILNAAPELKTNVNVSPQVNAVNDAILGAEEGIVRNTSNSNIARANIAANRLKGAKNIAEILAAKENAETQLKNQAKQAEYINDANNNATLNEYELLKQGNKAGVIKRNSDNLNNLAEDISQLRQKDAILTSSDNELMTELQNDITGQKKREYQKNKYIIDRANKNPALYKLIFG